MKLIFLGTGSAFITNKQNYQTNILLQSNNGSYFLIDCGTDIRHSLFDMGLDHSAISAVYISHLHADHCGGLEWLGFNSMFDSNCQRPWLYISCDLVNKLWNNALAAGMSSLQGKEVNLSNFFNLAILSKKKNFDWQDIHMQLIQTVHAMEGYQLMPSYGLIVQANDKKLFITTDICFIPQLYLTTYQQADLIFHDCELAKRPTGLHAHYNQLITLPAEIKAKMWLMHYNFQPEFDAAKDGFCGFVAKGQEFCF